MNLLCYKNTIRSFLSITACSKIHTALYHATSPLYKHVISLEVKVIKEGHLNAKNWIFKEVKHSDQSTFMAQGYNQSNYYTGTKFEYETLIALEKYNFSLERVGKAHDEGVDFKGVSILSRFKSDSSFENTNIWNLPDKSLSIVGQCKKYAKAVGTSTLQQFEGALSRTVNSSYHGPSLHEQSNTVLGILVSGSGFSKAAASYFMNGVSIPYFLLPLIHLF